MLVDLLQVPFDGQDVECAVSGHAFDGDARDFALDGPASLAGRLSRGEGGAFRLKGSFLAHLRLHCVRCLKAFPMDCRESLDLLFLPQSANVAPEGEPERGLSDDELSVSFYREEKIDLGLMVREQILLALPMKPLCREECKGLCQRCGADRNESECRCVTDAFDARWEPLAGLLGGSENASRRSPNEKD